MSSTAFIPASDKRYSLDRMEEAARRQLAQDFIEHVTHEFGWGTDMVLRPESRKPYVHEALDELSQADPTAFLATVVDIIHTNRSDDVMSKVSGPLQMLLETEPDKVIGQVEDLARRDATFRELLSWFIPSEPDGPVWRRVREIAGDVPW